MNPRMTWLWAAVAAGLFAFIYFFERRLQTGEPAMPKLLPGFSAAAVSSVQVRPAGQSEIRVERTNKTWLLTKPVVYPAREINVEFLLAVFEQLTPAHRIGVQELKNAGQSDEKYGFAPPKSTLIIQQADQQRLIHIGNKTAPGDQLFVKVAGTLEIYVVPVELLKLIPRTANDWRDTTLVDLTRLVSDRLVVTNAGNVLDLWRNPTNGSWRMSQPMANMRAHREWVEESLQRLQALRAEQFVPEDSKIDLEAAGLQPPELTLAFKQGTNTTVLLEFGKSPPDHPNQLYARRGGLSTVVTVGKDLVEPWFWSHSHNFADFIDPHLLNLTAVPDAIEVHAQEDFALQRHTNNTWLVVPPGYPADVGLINELVLDLSGMLVTIEKTFVTEPGLHLYGLTNPVLSYVFKASETNGAAGPTDMLVTRLDFGTNEGKVFARNPTEDSVYAVKPEDFKRLEELTSHGWKLRDRRIWRFTADDVARVTVQESGETRAVVRNGTNSWALAPGSQGSINPFAIEEAVHVLGELSAGRWVDRGEDRRAAYGLAADGHHVAVELKSGEKLNLELGKDAPSPSSYPYAAVTVDGQPWIFECPLRLYQLVKVYLSLQANSP